jgi:hypothetical protein
MLIKQDKPAVSLCRFNTAHRCVQNCTHGSLRLQLNYVHAFAARFPVERGMEATSHLLVVLKEVLALICARLDLAALI